MPADELVIQSPLVFELLHLLPRNKYIVTSPDSIICKSIVSLRQYIRPLGGSLMHLSQPHTFVQQLLLQMQHLEKKYKKGLLYFSLDHIVVLNGDTFLLHNLEALTALKVPNYKCFIRSYPLEDLKEDGVYISSLCYPAKITSLPFTIPQSVSANSFGTLCQYIIDPKDMKEGTRLRYFIDRCHGDDGVMLYV